MLSHVHTRRLLPNCGAFNEALSPPKCLFGYPCVQLRRYDLVIQLSEEGAALGARGMRASSRDTLRDLECDMALATALAQVGSSAVWLHCRNVHCEGLEDTCDTLRDLECDMALATALAQVGSCAVGPQAVHWLCAAAPVLLLPTTRILVCAHAFLRCLYDCLCMAEAAAPRRHCPCCWLTYCSLRCSCRQCGQADRALREGKPALAYPDAAGSVTVYCSVRCLLQCGQADRALREGKPALACARLQEALKLLADAPVRGPVACILCMGLACAVACLAYFFC